MAIFISVLIEGLDDQPLQLQEDIYLYLQPMFEQINNHTGRYVSLKKDVAFHVDSLPVLQRYVFEKKQAVRQLKPASISFICGMALSKSKYGKTVKKKQIFEIDKNQLINFLTEINIYIDKARQTSSKLFFRCMV